MLGRSPATVSPSAPPPLPSTTLSPNAAAISSSVLRLVSGEVKVGDGQEEGGASDKDVVVVLGDVRKSRGPGLGNGDVDDKVAGGGQAHDLATQGQRQHLGAVQPGGAVEHAVVHHHEQVDGQDGEALAHAVVGVLELTPHHGGVDLDQDDACQAHEDHLAATPLIRQVLGGDAVGDEDAAAVHGRQRLDRLRADAEQLVQDGLVVLDHVDARQAGHGLHCDRDERAVSVGPEDVAV